VTRLAGRIGTVVAMAHALLWILADVSASPALGGAAGGNHWGTRQWIVVAAFAVLAAGLLLRVAAGRRLRRDP
jgi:hypothetical protein